ncbi:MAG: CvpA family protein [Lachnospiraceae bacterium]
MDFILKHWLSVSVGVFLLAMILHGHYRGFLRIAVSMTALVLSLVIVRLATPYMTDFLKQNTAFHEVVRQGVLSMTGAGEGAAADTALPAGQRLLIEQLKLPEQIKEALIENNNNEVYRMLGVDAFLDYISAYVANMVLTVIGSVLLFIIVFIALQLLMRWLDLIARIPIIAGLNQIAGALLGGIQGLLILWFCCLVVSVCSGTTWASAVIEQINQSVWLSFLYRNNIFSWLLGGILNNLV